MEETLKTQAEITETARADSKKSLLSMYREAKMSARNFIKEVADVTGRKEWTVKMWLIGYNMPNDEVKVKLGAHFGVDPDGLFPDVKPYKRK